jgi:lipopolysaccharide biosynthesis protein
MKKILVHVHIYYVELWDEIKDCLRNIPPAPYDLYVTLVKSDAALESDILLFNPQTHIEIVENRGFDIGPFIHILSQVDLTVYDYVIKLHTKRNVKKDVVLGRSYGLNVSGTLWRDYLLAFLKTKSSFTQCLHAFDENEKLGMCAYHFLIREKWLKDDRIFLAKNEQLLKEVNLELKSPLSYVTGTMFIARAKLFLPLQKLNLQLADFEGADRKNPLSKAHAIERFLGLMIGSQGYVIADGFSDKKELNRMKWTIRYRNFCKFLYRNEVTESNKKIIEILGVRLYSKKLKSGV